MLPPEFGAPGMFKIIDANWVKLSVEFGKVDFFLMPLVQGLGSVSLRLDEIDKKILEKTASALELNDAFTLSHLWVLGAFEVLRTASCIAKKTSRRNHINQAFIRKIDEVKKTFLKISTPLAKMQPHQKSCYSIAYPCVDLNRGIAWQIESSEYISRKELSEVLLNLL